jgi:hypothetical protein
VKGQLANMTTSLKLCSPQRRRAERQPLSVTRRRLVVCVMAGVIAVTALMWQHTTNPGAHATLHAAPATPDTAATQTPDTDEFGNHPPVAQMPAPTLPPPAELLASATVVAERFATNFATANDSRDAWLAQIAPDVSAQLLDQYRLTDSRNLPHAALHALTGPLPAPPGAAVFDATYTDESGIEMWLEITAQGWKVMTVIPLPDPASPPSSAPGSR